MKYYYEYVNVVTGKFIPGFKTIKLAKIDYDLVPLFNSQLASFIRLQCFIYKPNQKRNGQQGTIP